MDNIASTYEFVETEVIGHSYEGRKMQILKICKEGCGVKPAIWIDGGMLMYDQSISIRFKPTIYSKLMV